MKTDKIHLTRAAVCGSILLFFLHPGITSATAQGTTHPGCPLCPGGGYSVQALERAGETGPGKATLTKGRLFSTLLIAPGSMSELQNSFRYGATERLELGLTYLIEESEFLGQFNYVLLTEKAERPALTVGMGIDRPGGDENAVYLVASKALDKELGQGWSGYLGASRRRSDDELFLVGGAAKVLSDHWAATYQYDGTESHLGLQTRVGKVNVSLLWLRLENIGGAIGIPIALD